MFLINLFFGNYRACASHDAYVIELTRLKSDDQLIAQAVHISKQGSCWGLELDAHLHSFMCKDMREYM